MDTDDAIKSLSFAIEQMNRHAASYCIPITSTARSFFTTHNSKREITPAFIDLMKNTACTLDINTSTWQTMLESIGYDSGDITPFEEVRINPDEDLLKIRIAGYAKSHPDASLYQAIMALLTTYDEAQKNKELEELAEEVYENIPAGLLQSMFKKAYTNMQTMSQLASKLRLTGEYLRIVSPDYYKAIDKIIALETKNQKLQSPILKETDLDDLADELITSAPKLAQEKAEKPNDLMLTIIAKIDLLDAQMAKKLFNAERLGKDIMPIKNYMHSDNQYREHFNRIDTLHVQLHELFKDTDAVLEEAEAYIETQEKKFWGLIANEDQDRLKEWLAKNNVEMAMRRVINKCNYKLEKKQIKELIIDTLKLQLNELFKGNNVLLTGAENYIKDQRQKVSQLTGKQDKKGLKKWLKETNIVSAIGTVINQCNDKLEKDHHAHHIARLAEQVQKLGASPKGKAIAQALAEVLAESDMTLERLIKGIDHAEPKSSLGRLKTAMGMHRNLFSQIINLFFPLTTNTMRLFKGEIQKKGTEHSEQNKLSKG